MSEGVYGSPYIIDSNDKSGLIIIVGAIGFSWTILTVIIRIVSKLHVKTTIGLEEVLVVFAAILALSNSSCVFVAVRHGLGQRTDQIPEVNIEKVYKLLWTSEVLYLVALGTGKAAALPLLIQLTHVRKFVIAGYALAAFIGCWTVVSVLVIGIRCHAGNPWRDVSEVKCSSMFTRWASVECLSIAIEVLIFGLFVSIVYTLKMRLAAKLKVAVAFSSRLPLVVPTILRIVYLRQGYNDQKDALFALVNAMIVAQVIIHYTTMAASFAYIKPFLRAFDSNLGATVKVDTLVSTGLFSSSRSKDETNTNTNNTRRQSSMFAKSAIAQDEQPINDASSTAGKASIASSSVTDPLKRVSKVDPLLQRFSLPKFQKGEELVTHEKHGSADSVTPIIKTQEWQVHTEARNVAYHAM